MSRFVRPGVGVVLTACLFAAALPAPGQEARARIPPKGSHVFRHFLKMGKLQPLQKVADLAGVPKEETLLVVFGDTRALADVARQTNGLSEFRRQGGAILIATDRPDRERLRDLKVSVNPHDVVLDFQEVMQDPTLAYQGSDMCPILKDVVGKGHPLLRGLRQGIATNRPSSLTLGRGCELSVLARLPKGCWDRIEGRRLEGRPPFAAATEAGPGKGEQRAPVLVLAGHGVFLNGMMVQPDNWTFARNCVTWLTNGGKRKYALFLEDGAVVRSFDVPLVQLPMPPVKAISGILRRLEEANFFNEILRENVDRTRLLQWLLLGFSGLLLLYGLSRLVRAQHRADLKAPLVAVRVAQSASALPAVARRERAVVQDRNCWEAARDLARLCFEGHCAAAECSPTPPVLVHGRRRLRREVERLWRLAHGAPRPVAPGEFAALVPVMARVRAALDDGALRFESNPRVATRGLPEAESR